ncbi:MAG: hypothetical protein ACRCSQ_04485, partial [Bacteroidales bacterium]
YRGNSGYAASLARNEWLWNMQGNMEFLKNKQATLFFRAYDLLHQRSTLSRRVTASYIEDIESNILTNYFVVGFTYRFNTMGKKKQKEEVTGTAGGNRPSDIRKPGARPGTENRRPEGRPGNGRRNERF